MLDVLGLQLAASLGMGVRVNHCGLGQIDLVVTREHMLGKSRPQGLYSSGPSGVSEGDDPGICLFGQRRCRDIGHKGCCTPLPSFCLLELGSSGALASVVES